MPALLGATLTASLACACAGTLPARATLTYESVPDGAEIFESGKSVGIVPVTRTYTSDGKSKTIQTPDVRAVWPSGAQTTYFTLLPAGSDDRVATLERPPNAPGLQQDLEHAKQVVAARTRDAARNRDTQQSDINRGTATCKREQSQGMPGGISGDCR
jgi:hypothetical protein